MHRHGKPEIMNTDQGSQFTSIEFIKTLKDADIQISMDGKGAWRDNVFVERLWRTIKYEEVYLRTYESVSAARESLGRYLVFYNSRRPHSSLDGKTPDQASQPVVTNPGGGTTEREIHLRNGSTLFKQSGPPLCKLAGRFHIEAYHTAQISIVFFQKCPHFVDPFTGDQKPHIQIVDQIVQRLGGGLVHEIQRDDPRFNSVV